MILPPLSNRLQACCAFIKPHDRVADIGCDHGYLGIHLLMSGIAESVISADINEQPLKSAMRNAKKFGTADKMSFYLSDGVKNIPRDFTAMVCAGMGADTMISILQGAPWLKDSRYRLILQCQSRRPELRRYLSDNGFAITAETLAQDGRFIYPIMEVAYQPSGKLTDAQCHISPALLQCKSPLLPAFYQRVMDGIKTTVDGLSHAGGEKYDYYKEIHSELLKLEDTIHGNCC